MEKGADKKKSSPNSYFVTSTNLPSSSPPSKICMMGIHHHQGNSPIDGGPTNNNGGANQTVGNIYSGETFANSSKLQQPFDIYPFAYSTTPYKSPGGSSMEFPFTYAQWKELERQAMIYKYMISSVPVPIDLLFPTSTTNLNFPSSAPANHSPISSIFNVGYSKNGDLEPGRCKRTDGKKWRCSRDVAPTQKYCERHLHRGRPRSRKPVELKIDTPKINHKKSRTVESEEIVPPPNHQPPLLLFNPKSDLTTRDMGLNDVVQLQHLMEEANKGFSDYRPIFHQEYFDNHQQQQSLKNVFSYQNFTPPEIEVPNEFIDAWSSIDNNTNVGSSISLNEGDLSPSLNLSVGNNRIENYRVNYKDSICWEPFLGGGPLAEALSSPATTVSSPSGVLQRTVFSHSDGSVCNSPTAFAAAEAPLQWLN